MAMSSAATRDLITAILKRFPAGITYGDLIREAASEDAKTNEAAVAINDLVDAHLAVSSGLLVFSVPGELELERHIISVENYRRHLDPRRGIFGRAIAFACRFRAVIILILTIIGVVAFIVSL